MVVGNSLDANLRGRGFIWTPGRMLDLGSLTEDGGSSAAAVNGAGQVVGSANGRAALWQGGKIYDLNERLAPGAHMTLLNAIDINERGQILAFGYSGYGYWFSFAYYLLTPQP